MKAIIFCLVSLTLCGCFEYKDYPMELVEGNYFDVDVLRKLEFNIDTKKTVINKLGEPFVVEGVKEENETWYYYMKRTRKTMHGMKTYQDVYIKSFLLKFNDGKLAIVKECTNGMLSCKES